MSSVFQGWQLLEELDQHQDEFETEHHVMDEW